MKYSSETKEFLEGNAEMSNVLPPPIPRNIKSAGNAPRIGGTPQPVKFSKEDYEYPSRLPIVIAVIALFASLLAWKFQSKSIFISILGYTLTPILILFCLGIDNYIQRIRTSKQLYFISDARFGKILRIVSIISLFFSLPHVSSLANSIAAWIAQKFPGLG